MRGQRAAVARELHDKVARKLSRASLRVQSLMGEQDLPELEPVVTEIHQASSQLRWMLGLRCPVPERRRRSWRGGRTGRCGACWVEGAACLGGWGTGRIEGGKAVGHSDQRPVVNAPITVMIVDDDHLVCSTVARLLGLRRDLHVLGTFSDGA